MSMLIRRPAIFSAAVLVVASWAPSMRAGAGPFPGARCLGRQATIIGTAGPDRIAGTSGDDVIVGSGGDDVILGGDGNDRICGGAGKDSLEGRYGNDLLSGGRTQDALDGGPGSDLLLGGLGRDRLNGGDSRFDSDTLVGGAGADILLGGDGTSDTDYLFGGTGEDFLDGGIGGADQLQGGPGDDYISGGEVGRDVVSYEFAPSAVVADLSKEGFPNGNASGDGNDHLSDVEGLIGSDFADSLTGGDGDEDLRGGWGDDIIFGGDGEDTIDGGRGDDALDGGPGQDQISFGDSSAAVSVSLMDGTATGSGTDTVSSFQHILGSFFDDTLTGDDLSNSLYASFGINTIFALGGDDRIDSGYDGDAGEGFDDCSNSGGLANCEYNLHGDPNPLPLISYPKQAQTVSDLTFISGGVSDGIGGPRNSKTVRVSLRRMTSEGCWWWNRAEGGFARGACGVPIKNKVALDENREWRVKVNAEFVPGSYEAKVGWYRTFGGCGGAFAPLCISFRSI
jgi:hypothetical protein